MPIMLRFPQESHLDLSRVEGRVIVSYCSPQRSSRGWGVHSMRGNRELDNRRKFHTGPPSLVRIRGQWIISNRRRQPTRGLSSRTGGNYSQVTINEGLLLEGYSFYRSLLRISLGWKATTTTLSLIPYLTSPTGEINPLFHRPKIHHHGMNNLSSQEWTFTLRLNIDRRMSKDKTLTPIT